MVIPGCSSNAGPLCASARYALSVIDSVSSMRAANPGRNEDIDYRPRMPSAMVAGTLTDSLRM
jgi:hypothetical protein